MIPLHPITGKQAVDIVDGNVLAGMLAPLFRVDATLVEITCAECGSRSRLAETRVEREQHSAIARCRSCTRTLLTVTERADAVVLRVAGLELSCPLA